MKILHVSRNMSYGDEGFYSFSVVREMHRRGHKVALVAPPGPLTDELKASEVEVHTFPFLKDTRLEVFRKKAIISDVGQTDWDLIHAHDLSLDALISGVATRLDVPYVLSLQFYEEHAENTRIGSNALGGVIAANEALREHGVNDLEISKQLVEVIQPGVDLDELEVTPVFREGLDPIVALGTRLVKEKRVLMFLDVAEALSEGSSPPTFLVLKQGPFEATMRQEVRRRGLQDNVMFQTNPNAYYDVLPGIDVLLSTDSKLELGIGILHAMGCGKPVISSGAAGVFHAVDDQETGCLVSLSEGPHEMINRLELLLQHPEEARKMGKRAREKVEEFFSLERMVDETISFFSRILDQ